MNRATAGIIAFLMALTPAWAGFTERKMQSTMSSAEKSGKLVAFLFYEDFIQYREERDIIAATSRNTAAKKAIPRAGVLVIEINKGDKDLDKLPACVARDGKTPRVVITDALGKKVIVEYEGEPNEKKEEEIEKKVEEARKPAKNQVIEK